MKNRTNVRWLTQLALLVAILLVLNYTPLGYLQIGPLSASLLTVPEQASFSFLGIALRSALKISALHSPISTRATKQTTKVPAGLTWNRAAPMADLPSTA